MKRLLTLTSIAHHGEYIGKGSVICALHSVSLIQGHNRRQIHQLRIRSPPNPHRVSCMPNRLMQSMLAHRELGYFFADMPSQATFEALVRNIPSMKPFH
jgi:hypothetical protein